MTINWVDSGTAATELGVKVGHLLLLRSRGFFKVGQHWIDIRLPGGNRPTYRWNVAECAKTLAERKD